MPMVASPGLHRISCTIVNALIGIRRHIQCLEERDMPHSRLPIRTNHACPLACEDCPGCGVPLEVRGATGREAGVTPFTGVCGCEG